MRSKLTAEGVAGTLANRTRRMAVVVGGWLPGLVLFYATLVLTRLPQLLGNLLFLDDYVLPALPHQDLHTGRFPLALESLLVEGALPGFSLSGLSPWLAAGGLALAAESVRRLARDIGVRRPVAAALPLPFVVHPCTNELLTWAVTRGTGLCLFACVQGYRVVRRGGGPLTFVSGGALIFAGGLGYEVSLLVPAAFAVGELALEARGVGDRRLRRPAAALVGAAALVILVKTGWRQLSQGADPRGGIAMPTATAELIHRVKVASNILSNVYLSPLAYHVGFDRGGTVWKWIPVALPLVAFVARLERRWGWARAARGAMATAGVIAVPVMPALVLTAMNESWRVSVPATLAFGVAAAVATSPWSTVRGVPALTAGTLVFVAALLVAPSRYYLDRRLSCNAIERNAVDALERFWRARGIASPRFAVRVVPFPDQLPWDPALDSRVVTEGFNPVTTSSLSAFKTAWFARQFLLYHHGLGVLDGQAPNEPEPKAARARFVEERVGFIGLTHDIERRATTVQLAAPERARG